MPLMIEPEKKDNKKKKKPEQKKGKPESQGEAKEADDYIRLVRLSGVVVDGGLTVAKALTKIKGVGPRVAESLVMTIEVPANIKIGKLNESQIEGIEKKIESLKDTLPAWMLNRRKDLDSGKNLHRVGPELDFQLREDINMMKKMRSYKGVRHTLNLPVRGQRTRSSGRIGGTVGVARKKVAPAKSE